MSFNSETSNRHSIRLRDYDYRDTGGYFVTICSLQRECLFGEVVDGNMRLNHLGEIVLEEWLNTAGLRPNVHLDAFVVMPNHIHAVIFIQQDDDACCERHAIDNEPSVGAHRCAPGLNNAPSAGDVGAHRRAPDASNKAQIDSPDTPNRAHVGAPLRRRQSGSLGSIIAGFKSAATKRINTLRDNPGCPVWQRNYYDRVIRSEEELANIRQYIVNNPAKWDQDHDNPVNNA